MAAMAISVSDGVTSATSGDRLTYTISLRNDGAAGSGALDVRFEPPSGVDMTAVDHEGTRKDGVATWALDVPAGATMTLTVAANVGAPPAGANGLAGIACIVHNGTPSLCATDMNQIPGRSDINAVVDPPAPAPTDTSVPWLAGAGALAMVALFGVGGVLLIRRRRHHAAGVGADREGLGREARLSAPVDALVAGQLGFIGLGVMGEPMCRNLAAKSGETVAAFDRDPERRRRLPRQRCTRRAVGHCARA